MPFDSARATAEPWSMLGRRLAEYRKAAGYTQETLAAHPGIHYGRSTVANVERGRQPVGRSFWAACDAALQTGGVLTDEYDSATLAAGDQRRAAITSTVSETPEVAAAGLTHLAWNPVAVPAAHRSPHPTVAGGDAQFDHFLWAPAGRALPGLAIPAQLYPAVVGDHVMTQIPAAYADGPFMQRPGRTLVVGQIDGPDPASFVMDSRHARRRLRGASADARLPIPRAYRLDHLTFALLWAVANYDQALLADDAVIAASTRDTAGYALMNKSTASRDLAADATAAGQMWIGSQFCADHIRRHIPELTGAPVFWTREQRGEEAATWLLFTHKHDYLEATARGTGSEQPIRTFCVPRDAVTTSPLGERALLLLAVALMESYGIHTAITEAAELAATPGFVADQQRWAITATWVGADGIWYVDVTDHRATLREYRDATGYAISHSVTAAPTPHQRVHHLADYLGLDWAWLIKRCGELAEWGTAGIAQPRSRLLSLAGVDRACHFIATSARARY